MLTRVIGMPCSLSGSPSASPASCDITVPTHAASICLGSTLRVRHRLERRVADQLLGAGLVELAEARAADADDRDLVFELVAHAGSFDQGVRRLGG